MKGWITTQVAPLRVPPPLRDAKLISHFLFTRHGARPPLFIWSDYPIDTIQWKNGDEYESKWHNKRIPIVNGSPFDFSKVPNNGRLLEEGVKQQENLGKFYYNYLSVQNKLLPPAENYDSSQIYIRSSFVPRTIESAVSFLHGMYYPTTPNQPLAIQTGQPGEEVLCPSGDMSDFLRAKTKQFFEIPEFEERLSLIPHEIMKVVPKSKVDQMLAGDFPYCLKFGGYKLPKIVEDDNRRFRITTHGKASCFGTLYSFLNSNIGFSTTGFIKFVGKKAYGPIIELFVSRLKKFLDQKTDVKFTLFSAHDITVSSVLIALGFVNMETAPPYASHLAAELWERRGKRALRFAINGEVLRIKKDSELIEVEEFIKKYVD